MSLSRFCRGGYEYEWIRIWIWISLLIQPLTLRRLAFKAQVSFSFLKVQYVLASRWASVGQKPFHTILPISLLRQGIKETEKAWCGFSGERGTGLAEETFRNSELHGGVHLVSNQKPWKLSPPSFNLESVGFLFIRISSPFEFLRQTTYVAIPVNKYFQNWDFILYCSASP